MHLSLCCDILDLRSISVSVWARLVCYSICLLVNGTCSASAAITLSVQPGKLFEWSLWQPRQHETTRYSAITWRAKDTTESGAPGKCCLWEGKWGWAHMILITVPNCAHPEIVGMEIWRLFALSQTTNSWPLVNIGLCTSGEKTFSTL